MRTSHLGHYAVMLCLQKTQGDYNSRWSVLIAPFQSWWRTITKEFKTEGVTGECSNSPISVSAFLQNTNTRGNYTMCSVQQEHLTGMHSMIGDRTYQPVLFPYTVCGVLRNSLKKQIRFYHMLMLIGSMHPCSSPTNTVGIILTSLSSYSSYGKWSEQCTLHTLHIIWTPFPHISK